MALFLLLVLCSFCAVFAQPNPENFNGNDNPSLASECVFDTAQGIHYDMQTLDTKDRLAIIETENGPRLLRYNLCRAVRDEQSCANQQGMVCMYEVGANGNGDAKMVAVLAKTGKAHTDATNDDIEVMYTNGEMNGAQITTYINYVCQQNQQTPVYDVEFSETDRELDIQVTTKMACENNAQSTEHGKNDGNRQIKKRRKGMSRSSVMLTILLSVFLAYIAVGCIINSLHSGFQGIDSVPHRSFWSEVPGLIADGYLFIQSKIMGLFGRTGTVASAAYEHI